MVDFVGWEEVWNNVINVDIKLCVILSLEEI